MTDLLAALAAHASHGPLALGCTWLGLGLTGSAITARWW